MNVESILREELADRAAALRMPDDPYIPFQRLETRHRRTRRVRVAVVAAAVAVLAGLQGGVLPMPGWAPAIALADSDEAMINSPVRGSLAGDTTFLEGMRAQIKDMANPGEIWRVTDRKKIRFLYAGDVGDTRLVLAYVPVRFGFVTDPQLVWYAGPVGAPAGQLEEAGNVDAGEPSATIVTTSSERPGLALLVGPQGSTAAISPGYEFGADGRLRFERPVAGEPGTGVAQMVLPAQFGAPAVTMSLTRDGRTVDVPAGGGFSSDLPGDDVYEKVIANALGKRQFDHELLRGWIQAGLNQARVALEDARIEVRWTGEINGQAAALFTVQEPGHGVLAFAMHGTPGSHRDDLRLLLPAAGAQRRPIAWRLFAETGEAVRTTEVVVVAPAGAAQVRLTPAGGTPVKVLLDRSGKGTASLGTTTAATVSAYAADGSLMGSSPVPPFDDGGGLLGQSPATRVVD